MFVHDRMTRDPITIQPDSSFEQAMKTLRKGGFRRLPVVDKGGRLVGIVTETDLLHASPSQATSLDVWEISELLSRLRIRSIMSRDVIRVRPETTIEEAARLLLEHKIGALPVVDPDDHPIGIITESDIFRAFVELFAARPGSARITVDVPEKKGVLARLATTIASMGGSIESLNTFEGATSRQRRLVIKIRDLAPDALVPTLEALGDRVIDVREEP